LVGIKDFKHYINAGVLLMNLKKIREDNLMPIFNRLAENDFPTVDQDVLNNVCYGNIYFLDQKFNVMPKNIKFIDNPELEKEINFREFVSAYENPSIIHYVDSDKPWNNPNMMFAEEWIKYNNQYVSFFRGE
jgi:lipopolysaccharide biosynthesis glycosyltransferase